MKNLFPYIFLFFAISFCSSCTSWFRNSIVVELRDLSGRGGIGFVNVSDSAVPIGPLTSYGGLLYPSPGDKIQVEGKWFWTGEPFEFSAVLSDRNFDSKANTLFLVLQPDLTIDSKWGAIAPQSLDEKLRIQKYFQVVPAIVRNRKDDPNFRPLIKQENFYYRLLRSISRGSAVSSYRGWIDISQPQTSLQLGYWWDERDTFEGWKLKTTAQAILPADTNDVLILFDVDTTRHTTDVYHLSFAKNIDLLDYPPCSAERIKDLIPIATLNMQPAGAYTPPALFKSLEEKVVDLRD